MLKSKFEKVKFQCLIKSKEICSTMQNISCSQKYVVIPHRDMHALLYYTQNWVTLTFGGHECQIYEISRDFWLFQNVRNTLFYIILKAGYP